MNLRLNEVYLAGTIGADLNQWMPMWIQVVAFGPTANQGD